MSIDLLFLIFLLFYASCYLLLDGGTIEVLSGFVLLSNGVNLFLLSLSSPPEEKNAPLLDLTEKGSELIDPLPQAMILTAIVIGLGLLSLLAMVAYLIMRRSRQNSTHDKMEG